MDYKNSIGTITKVFANKIVIEVPDINAINYNHKGDFYNCDGINTFISIYKSRYQKFIYQITGLYEEEKPFIKGEEASKFMKKAFFEASPIGEIVNSKFEFGLSKFPMIGSDVFLTLNKDIEKVLKISNDKISIALGHMATHNNYMPKFPIDKLFSQHMSVLGNTGSGKSTTVRKLLHELINLSDKTTINIDKLNFIIFDVHDEYHSIPNEYLDHIEMEEIAIPLETLNTEDWINLVQPSEAAQLPVLMQSLRMACLLENEEGINSDWIKAFCALQLYDNVQTEVVGKRTKVINLLEQSSVPNIEEVLIYYNRFGNFDDSEYEQEFKSIIKSFIKKESGSEYEECELLINEYLEKSEPVLHNLDNLMIAMEIIFLFEEMKGNAKVRNYCSTLVTRIENLLAHYSKTLFDSDPLKLQKFKNTLKHNKPFTVFNCSTIDDNDLLFFTSYILKQIYGVQKEDRLVSGTNRKIIHFIFDEAHKYINENDDGNIRSLKAFEQIAKEGRKFGMFMLLASQRPSEISKTVLSQCNNFIIHRIRNSLDLEQMRRSIPYIDDAQVTRVSYLKTGAALLVGEAFSIPMELIIDGKEYGKVSETLMPSKVWK